MAKKRNRRPEKYEKKLELDENVEFDDLFKVAIHHDPKKVKKAPAPKKKKKKS